MQRTFKASLAISAFVLPSFILLSSSPALAQYQADRDYCDRYANDYAERNRNGGTLQGATRGAAGGAIFGAIGGSAGTGAAVGAAAGALGGTIRKQESRDNLYRQAYDDCMRQRGHLP